MTTTTGAQTTLSTTDPRTVFGRGVAQARDVIAGVSADQLDRPTPCTEFDVEALLGHLVSVLPRVAAIGRGDNPFALGDTAAVPAGGWVDAWTAAADEARAAWTDDATLAQTVVLPWAQLSGGETLEMYTNEVVIHTWDLATATGQRPEWDEGVLAVAFAAIQRDLPAEGRIASFEAVRAKLPEGAPFSYPFAEAVPVADDAPLIDRLAAWNGRQP